MVLTIETLTEIYPDHTWLDLSEISQLDSKLSTRDLADRDYHLSRVDLNQLCMVAVKKWLSEIFDLELKSVFPCIFGGKDNLEFISKLVNGFALQVGKTRLVFIPSQSIDLTEIEIPQEWVDLPNWVGDYYIPIQVDVEGKYLHLWTFISHYDLKNNGEFDRVFRNYEIADGAGSKSLDVLFTACELHSLGELTPKRAEIAPVPILATDEANKLIKQLQQHRSGFSPRLESPSSSWGAILNVEKCLEDLNSPKPEPDPKSSDDYIKYIQSLMRDGWEFFNNVIYSPQAVASMPAPIYMERFGIKIELDAVKGISLKSPEEIKTAIAKVYEQQGDVPLPKEIIGVEDLIPLLKSCKNDKVWWQAAEHLWAIKPDLSPSTPAFRKLKMQFAGREIALMIATIKTLQNRFAVLVRLYPAGGYTALPPQLQLSVRDEQGVNFLIDSQGKPIVVTARAEVMDSSIQLYFIADSEDRFNACISLGSTQVTEDFPLPPSHLT
jgi:Protein of unknown function (DUF1822)